ncbi:MAG: branched-chain amino acid ABC transporter permease [Acidimicrobiales bacterium]|nr:branched-chain amino acid ABC transporter permease [Acidimicrobiales bacterium]
MPAARAARLLLRLVLAFSFTVVVAAVGPTAPAGAQTTTTSTNPGTTGSTVLADDQPAPSGGELVRGTLTFADESGRVPVDGAVVIVSTEDGTEVTRVTSGADGKWEVPLPGPGTYQVTIDVESLPAGVGPEDPANIVRTIEVATGQKAGAGFPLAKAGAEVSSPTAPEGNKFLKLLGQGIALGSIIAMATIGLSLIYGTTGLINFAHGELVTFGALVAWWLSTGTGGPGLSLVLAGLLAVVAGAAFGGAQEKYLFAPLRKRRTSNVALIVVTIGWALVLRHLYLIIFGGSSRPYDEYVLQREIDVGPFTLAPKSFWTTGISLLVLVLVGLMLQRTRLGTAMRAVADNRDLAASSGIDVRRVILLTWVLGGGLAALGGVLLGLTNRVSWSMGALLLLQMFAAMVLGGLGSAYGAMVGGLVIGIVTTTSTELIPAELDLVPSLFVLILLLLVRPQGLLGRAERVG